MAPIRPEQLPDGIVTGPVAAVATTHQGGYLMLDSRYLIVQTLVVTVLWLAV
ncbi:MAG: hypothetical protein HY815_29800, partial [Candidatus Riflebacteria bacterium]|nr:hypothetical protein [Candidatus Riflebacteria bacterium]